MSANVVTLCIVMLVFIDSSASLKYAGSWIPRSTEWTPIFFQVKQYWLQSRKDRWLPVFTTLLLAHSGWGHQASWTNNTPKSYRNTHHVWMVLDHLWNANSLYNDNAYLSIRISSRIRAILCIIMRYFQFLKYYQNRSSKLIKLLVDFVLPWMLIKIEQFCFKQVYILFE